LLIGKGGNNYGKKICKMLWRLLKMFDKEKYEQWLISIDHEAMYDKFRDDFVDYIYENYHCNHEDQAMKYEEDSDVWESFLSDLKEEDIIYK
jgi:hypothetical protein